MGGGGAYLREDTYSIKYGTCRSPILSLVQFSFSFVSYSLLYINIEKNKGK